MGVRCLVFWNEDANMNYCYINPSQDLRAARLLAWTHLIPGVFLAIREFKGSPGLGQEGG
jgi:hypothetical protein